MPPYPQELKHTFISYAKNDRQQALSVCGQLERQGISCWIAPRDVRKGYTWAGEIVHAIQNAHVMVLLFSRHSNASVEVLREVTLASGKGKQIYTLRLEDITPTGGLEYRSTGAATLVFVVFVPGIDFYSLSFYSFPLSNLRRVSASGFSRAESQIPQVSKKMRR
jgi:hypothetical protein